MANWTVKQVTNWLKENDLKKQVKIFKEKNIDGNALMKLTDDEISQLFIEVNEDGISQESTIGMKSRFRVKLEEWKLNINNDEAPGDSLKIAPTNSHQDNYQEHIAPKISKKKETDNVKREDTYLIDDEIEIKFFKNSKFLEYFINFITQETISIDIKISKVNANNNDQPSYGYTIKLIGTKQENRIVRNFIKTLLKSIKIKIYNQKDIQNWLIKSNPIDIVQKILDRETHMFTTCQFINRQLQIYYFENEKFNSSENLHDLNKIIQNQIVEEHIIWLSIRNHHTMNFIAFNTHESLLKYQICVTEQFLEEFENIVKQYNQDDTLVLINVNVYHTHRIKAEQTIKIFGYKKIVDEVLRKLEDLFDKHRLRKFRFKQLSTIELGGIANLCSADLRDIVYDLYNGGVELHIEKNEFYASLCLKDEVRNRTKALLTKIKTKTFKNIDFYYNIADKLCSNMKNIAQRNHSYCNIQLKTKVKSYPILRGDENILNTSKSIIEQSNLFCSSPLVCLQTKIANGSIEILIGDIALQKVDIIIIPSTTSGLKESLIERAGEIIEKPLSKKDNSIPFITETTGGNLNCQKILFINWSLPTTVTNDDDLSESIRSFISKTIQYIITDSQQSNFEVRSIAFAVPDSFKQEDILAEEIIEETINQINLAKSISLKVSFILLPDQQTIHKQFLNAIQTIQKNEDHFGIFYCPTTTVTVTLMSLDDDSLKKCEEKLSNYLKRAIFKMKLDGFQHWNQSMINSFYQYSTARCVLPKIDNQQQMILFGPINNVYEVHQKYQRTNASIQFKQNLSSELTGNILISYSPEDSMIPHRLANRLIDEGLSVSIKSNQTLENINQSTCIILCINQNYFQNKFCEKQVKYADEIGKNLILIRTEYFQPIEWLQKLIEKHSYFQFFGSDHHFNFEYEKLLLKIFQSIKPIDLSTENSIQLHFLLTPEQKKFKYDKNMEKIKKGKKGRINEDDKQDLSEKIHDILQSQENQCQKYISQKLSMYSRHRSHFLPDDGSSDCQEKENELIQIIRFDMGITSSQQWLEKLKKLETILNIPPFTCTGDLNDAVFPVLNVALENPYLLYSLGTHYHIPKSPSKKKKSLIPDYMSKQKELDSSLAQKKISIIDDTPKEEPLDSSPKPKKPSVTDDSTKEEQQIETKMKKRSSIISNHGNNIVNRYKKKKKKPSSPKVSFTTSEELEFQSKFAKQMQKNNDEFEKFCQDYQQPLKKPKIQAYPTALFGPSPFSDIKSEPRKTSPPRNKIELPLKFPWNGVFDTKTPSVTWTNPSVHFFFLEIN